MSKKKVSGLIISRPVLSTKKILAGTLKDNRAYELTIGIPGTGKINIKISFEKEEINKRFMKEGK